MSADLGPRLRALRRQSGGVADSLTTPAPSDPTLIALQRLRARLPRPSRCEQRSLADAGDEAALASYLGGRVIDAGLLLVEQQVELPGLPRAAPDLLAEAAARLGGDDPGSDSLWLLDTETTGLAGGTGTLAFLVGLARWRDGVLGVRQYLISAFAGEARMLCQVTAALGAAPLVITYNGRSFDAPLLAARSRLARVGDPLAGARHLDLLPLTRRAFMGSWPDCRLATVEQRLLGLRRLDDLPGWQAPRAWLEWVRLARPGELRRVLTHNLQDLASLARLLPALAAVYSGQAHPSADPRGVAAWLARRDGLAAARDHLLRHRSRLCPAGRAELARLARRSGDWPLAVELWRELASLGQAEALESLAKYAEHRGGDPAAALAHTEALMRLQGDTPALRRRARRLHRKLARRQALSRPDPRR